MTFPYSGRIALVHPPFRWPSATPWLLGQAADVMRGYGNRVEAFDANLDFFGDNSGSAFRKAIDVLRSESFYDPARCVRALQVLRCSRAGARLTDSRNSSDQNVTQALEIANDIERNPLLPFCRAWFASHLMDSPPDTMAVLMSAKEQLLGALTWIVEARRSLDRLEIVLVTDPLWFTEAVGGREGKTSGFDVVAYHEFMPHAPTPDGAVPEPAYPLGALPGPEYLAPIPVVSVSGFGEGRCPRWVAPSLGTTSALLESGRGPDEITTLVEERLHRTNLPPLGVTVDLDSAARLDAGRAYAAGLRLVRWNYRHGDTDSLLAALLPFATAGIWNHVVVAETSGGVECLRTLEANPNIVHSWSVDDADLGPFQAPPSGSDETVQAYGQVRPLPGRALWQLLDDPVYLLLYAARFGSRQLSRWRVRDSGNELYAVGRAVSYHFVAPADLPDGYLDEICRMVTAGGAVDTGLVRRNLQRAFLVAYALEDGIIAGNSSLKHPRGEYLERVHARTGIDLEGFLERGYTSVRPEYRGFGIATRLLEGLTSRAQGHKIYSIIREADLATQKIAIRNRTEKITAFYSEVMGEEIGLWMPVGTMNANQRRTDRVVC